MKNLKTLALATALTVVLTSAFAAEQDYRTSSVQGYKTSSEGLDKANSYFKLNYVNYDITVKQDEGGNAQFSSSGKISGLGLAYGYRFDIQNSKKFYIAPEIGIDILGGDLKGDDGDYLRSVGYSKKTLYKALFAFTLGLEATYVINDKFDVFANIARSTTYYTSQNNIYSFSSRDEDESYLFSSTATVLGAGLSYSLSDKVSIQGSYEFSEGAKFDLAEDVTVNGVERSISGKHEADTNIIRIGLAFNW